MTAGAGPTVNLTAIPLAGTPFAEAWLAQDAAAAELLPGDPRTLDAYRAKAEAVDARFDPEARRRAVELLHGGGPDAEARREAFVRDGGLMVTTGQQPGLFGGPLYALYKGLTAAALAHRLEEALGRPVLPVFWIASEHHVWEDVATAHVVGLDNTLGAVSLPQPAGSAGRPLHRIPVGPPIADALERFWNLHPDSEFAPHWRELLARSYTPDASLASAFGEVMKELLGRSGVFLVYAHDPRLKALSLPLLLEELRDNEAREGEIADFDRRVQESGFEPQVSYLEGATNLFFEGPAGRERIFREGSGFRLRGSETVVSRKEVVEKSGFDPSLLSPNVLLRPVIEAAVLPTVSYVAGPGEIAYLPHAGPVFAAHGIRRPVVHPRLALTVLEGKIEKTLRKLGLNVADLALPEHELASRIARDDMPDEVTAALRSLEASLASGTDALENAAKSIDPTLEGPLDAFRSQGAQLVSDIERKILQSLKRQNEIVLGQAAKAQIHLFPLGKPQERVFNPFYYLARYDEAYLDAVNERAREAVLP